MQNRYKDSTLILDLYLTYTMLAPAGEGYPSLKGVQDDSIVPRYRKLIDLNLRLTMADVKDGFGDPIRLISPAQLKPKNRGKYD